MSLTLVGKGIVTRISPFSKRFEKSLALSPYKRKSSASTGRKSGSSAFGLCSRAACSAANRACAPAGESWKFSEGMWQSAHARPLPPSWLRLRSLKAVRPRATASHGLSSQLSCVGPLGFESCPKPVLGLTAVIVPTRASKPKKATTELLSLFIVFLHSFFCLRPLSSLISSSHLSKRDRPAGTDMGWRKNCLRDCSVVSELLLFSASRRLPPSNGSDPADTALEIFMRAG